MRIILALFAVLPAAFSTLVTSAQRQVLVEEANDERGAVFQFRVEQTDTETNKTWTCLRTEFSLDIVLESEGGGKLRKSMSNNSVVDGGSNCSSLRLDLDGVGEGEESQLSTVTLTFNEETSHSPDKADTRIIYLDEVNARVLTFNNPDGTPSTTTAEARYEFAAQGSNENRTATPVEVELIAWSFKCYRGFTMTANNTVNPTERLSLQFRQFRLERYTSYSDKSANIGVKSTWQRIFSCDADISTVLPILVGCVLAGIILVTLIGYLVARRRSRYAYEEL